MYVPMYVFNINEEGKGKSTNPNFVGWVSRSLWRRGLMGD